ncbi:TonB-dependent receptor [Bowmanella yangjiangensis]|uniref:TonB-dependent receptor n=1 Tax=Bowmanella yangjiangensis TaxID=2811230 RepID=A0ABS3CX96_9ALTE|nr:TonB-dependent receptor [Bowmanella yangjiangensis]MBN7821752.1 TonB-dependent receptor [Bowmanella yangjiangensis]
MLKTLSALLMLLAPGCLMAAPLAEVLSALARQHQVAIVFNQAELADIQVDMPDTELPLQVALQQLLGDLPLDLEISDTGIVIRRHDQSTESQPELTKVLEEVRVTGTALTANAQQLERDYQAATRASRQLKQQQIGDSDYLLGAMLKGLPAENLAESMQALPGLSISRDRGEGLNINAGGLGPAYQLTLLNGRRIANTENVRNSNQYGQEYRFDTLSAGVFSAVELHKTADSALPAGAIGAVANIISEKPLSLPSQQTQLTLSGTNLSGDNQVQPNMTISSNGFSTQRQWAWLAKLNYQSRVQRQFQYETWHWGRNADAPAQYHYPQLDDTTLVPVDGLALTIENEDRTRLSALLTAQWQPTSHTSWLVSGFLSDTDYAFDEHRLSVNPASKTATPHFISADNALSAVTYRDADIKSAREVSGLNYQHQTWQASGEHQASFLGWPLLIQPYLSLSQAISRTTSPITRLRSEIARTDLEFAIDAQRLGQFTLSSPALSPDSFSRISGISERHIRVDNQVLETGVDATIELSQRSQLDLGLVLSRHHHQYHRQDIELDSAQLAAIDAHNALYYQALPTPFEADFAAQIASQWLIPSLQLQSDQRHLLTFGAMSQSDKLNSYRVDFRTTEAFVNGQWQLPGITTLQLQSGIRYSATQSQSQGFGLFDDLQVVPRHSQTRYRHWLPSLSLVWQPGENWQWRSALSRSMALPNYSDLNPKIHAHSGGQPYAEGGNPALRPVESRNLSSSLSYTAAGGQLSLLWFDKQLSHFISEQVSQLTYMGQQYNLRSKTNQGQGAVSGIVASLSLDIPLPINGLDSLGLSTSITQLNHEGEYQVAGQPKVRPLEGVSKRSANLRMALRGGPWQGAVNMNFRSRYLEQLDNTNRADIWVDDFTSLDTSLSFTPLEQVLLRLDIYNLLNQNKRRYAQDGHAQALMKVEDFGVRFAFSLQLQW